MTTDCGGSAVNDTICQLRIPQNRSSGPENGIFHGRAFLNAAIPADPAIGDGSVDLCGGGDLRSHAKAGFEVSLASAEVEPAGLAFDMVSPELAAFDQFQKGRNDGGFLPGRE